MLISLTGKHLSLGPAIQKYADDLAKQFQEKFAVAPIEVHGSFDKDVHGSFSFVLIAHMAKAWTARSHSHARDPYKAVDEAFALLKDQIRRHKKRDTDHHHHHDNHHYQTKVDVAARLMRV